MISNS